MMRNILIGLWAALLLPVAFSADFTAEYSRGQDSPSTVSRSWYGGDVVDGKFVYGLGHSHNSNGDNSILLYDPAANVHTLLFASTGNKWVYDTNVAGSGHWSDPSIVALSNRNNHVEFYLPGRNEWWVFNGTFWYQQGTLLGGRFDIATKKWVNVSKTWAEFNAGVVAGGPPNIAANASVAVCKDLNTVVFFGGMNAVNPVVLLEPNAGAEPYKWTTLAKPPIFQPSENARESAACVGDTVYFVTAQQRVSGPCCQTPNPAPVWKFHVPTRTWTRLADGPPGGYFPTLTYDSDVNALLYYGGGTGGGSNALWAYDLLAGTWQNLTGTTAAPKVDMMTAGFIPGHGTILQGGKVHDASGATIGGASKQSHRIKLTRSGTSTPPPDPVPEPEPPPPEPEPPPPEPEPEPDPVPSFTSIEAEDFTTKTHGAKQASSGASGGKFWNLWSNGYLETSVQTDGAKTLIVVAGGTSVANIWPIMVVSIDGVVAGEFSVQQKAFLPYTISPPSAGTHTLRIAFTNDALTNNEDRNLLIDLAKAGPPVEEPPPVVEPPVEDTSISGTFTGTLDSTSLDGTLVSGADEYSVSGQATMQSEPPPVVEPPPVIDPEPTPLPSAFTWQAIPFAGQAPALMTKHGRLQQAGNGRVYTLGWDGVGPPQNTGRQEVYSFDPNSTGGDWRMDAPYCGTQANPSHWHTDEAGTAWDAKRGVLWKLAGTVYGPEGECVGTSVKAKAITFNPTTNLWTVPAHIDQTGFGYVANGVIDTQADQIIQIIDTAAKHLDLITGQWATYPLPNNGKKFNAWVCKVGRVLYWINRIEKLESYNLDTHKYTNHGTWIHGSISGGWAMAMPFAVNGRLVTIWPVSGPTQPRYAAIYDPATSTWTKIDQGDGWGNFGTVLSDGRIVLTGGGINGEADKNPSMWIGTLN